MSKIMKPRTIASATFPHPTLDPDEKRPASAQPLLALAERYAREAAGKKCDILCLPESFANFSRRSPAEETAEPVDGPIMTFLGRISRQYSVAIVTTVYLRDEKGVVNRGVAFGKNGKLAGSYEKVHIPQGEDCVAGTSFPVFEIEGIKAGIQICHDLYFPEGCRILALEGADLIFWPNMWSGYKINEVLMRARAMENMTCLVSSAYFLGGSTFFRAPKLQGRSCIISWDGTILAEVGERTGLAVATIDFNEPRAYEVSREKQLFQDRRPGTYGRLVKP